MRKIFITSTGTDIGKTYLTSILIKKLKLEKKNVKVIKPIITGFNKNNFLLSDSSILLKSMLNKVTLDEIKKISPYIYSTPSSPYHASKIENKTIDYKELVSWCNKKIKLNQKQRGYFFIEGVGGVMVPIVKNKTVIDLISSLLCPVILVVGSYLGSLSHTLSAVSTLKNAGIKIINIIVNESNESSININDTVSILSDFIPDMKIRICLRNSLFNDKEFNGIIEDINSFY